MQKIAKNAELSMFFEAADAHNTFAERSAPT
jgi:hypothetical protein